MPEHTHDIVTFYGRWTRPFFLGLTARTWAVRFDPQLWRWGLGLSRHHPIKHWTKGWCLFVGPFVFEKRIHPPGPREKTYYTETVKTPAERKIRVAEYS